jgi:hypothetical protein
MAGATATVPPSSSSSQGPAPTAGSSQSTLSPTGGSHLSKGAIAGIVIGVVVGVAAIAGALFILGCMHRRKRQQAVESEKNAAGRRGTIGSESSTEGDSEENLKVAELSAGDIPREMPGDSTHRVEIGSSGDKATRTELPSDNTLTEMSSDTTAAASPRSEKPLVARSGNATTNPEEQLPSYDLVSPISDRGERDFRNSSISSGTIRPTTQSSLLEAVSPISDRHDHSSLAGSPKK